MPGDDRRAQCHQTLHGVCCLSNGCDHMLLVVVKAPGHVHPQLSHALQFLPQCSPKTAAWHFCNALPCLLEKFYRSCIYACQKTNPNYPHSRPIPCNQPQGHGLDPWKTDCLIGADYGCCKDEQVQTSYPPARSTAIVSLQMKTPV